MDYKDYREQYTRRPAARRTPTRRQDGRPIIIAIAALSVILIVIVAVMIAGSMSRPSFVARSVTAEAGRSSISASDFLIDKNHTAEFAEGTRYDLSKVGEYDIDLIVDGERCTTKLIVADTKAPTGRVEDFSVWQGMALSADACVLDIVDATEVEVRFKKKPDLNSAGKQNVTVILEDRGGNVTEYSFVLNVVAKTGLLYTHYVSELGEPLPAADVFTGRQGTGEYLSELSGINPYAAGIYMLQISADGKVHDVVLEIADRIAPTATVTPQVCYNEPPSPSDFVSNINDKSRVTVSYETEPQTASSGKVDVSIVLSDEFGNSTVYQTYFTIMNDSVAPVISKAPEALEIDAGSPVIWHSLVEASDDSGHVELTLDTSSADLNKPGKYTVEIVARDAAGNETRRALVLTVHDAGITEQMLWDTIASLEKSIGIKDNMRNEEKLYAVFRYVYDSMKYSNTSTHIDWRSEAYAALSGGFTGDCFTYCAVSYAILRYNGFDALIVERAESAKIEGTGTHFWVLVNIGGEQDPQWYHFDATPQRAPYNLATYLMTDAQIEAYTRWRNDTYKTENYYTYDKEKFPEVSVRQRVSIEIPSQYFAE